MGVEILYQTNKDGSTDAGTQQEGAVGAGALVEDVEDVHSDTEAEDVNLPLPCFAFGDMDVETLNRLLQRLPDDIGNLSIRDIVTRSTK